MLAFVLALFSVDWGLPLSVPQFPHLQNRATMVAARPGHLEDAGSLPRAWRRAQVPRSQGTHGPQQAAVPELQVGGHEPQMLQHLSPV